MAHRRPDGRTPKELRRVALTTGVMKFADASCLVEWGDTKVICTATVEEKVPPFLRNSGTGWVTAEYAMLPRSSRQRIEREAVRGRPALDLTYAEDAAAEVDMNVVMTGRGAFVEVQGTAERTPFRRTDLDRMLRLAAQGIRQLLALQRRALQMRDRFSFPIG